MGLIPVAHTIGDEFKPAPRLPLESVLHAYRIAGREAWTALCDGVPPGEEGMLAELGARWIDEAE